MTREEAVWTLQEAVDEAFGAGIEIITRDGGEAIEMAIEALQERDTGKWEHTHNFTWSCSNCGYRTTDKWWNYCPKCGAKMEVDE